MLGWFIAGLGCGLLLTPVLTYYILCHFFRRFPPDELEQRLH